ncbi:MAG: hypothetical protein EAZ76_01675 [Nostocales cyanobacterium]|nr:MAG: hypothetical protein EAZ87_04930 [Nostocales cyanobacterium]TAF20359.1 MAG: hypothetical protein EAZ76_01675 [Nostocales cyanobacterium]
MTIQHIPTDYGILSVVKRRGYYYAVRTHFNRKRQIYLGKIVPDTDTLNEVAKDIYSSDREWYTNHPPKPEKLRARVKDTNNLSLRDDLLRVCELCKVFGEERIEQQIRTIIKVHLP